jgi:hypothetical protein
VCVCCVSCVRRKVCGLRCARVHARTHAHALTHAIRAFGSSAALPRAAVHGAYSSMRCRRLTVPLVCRRHGVCCIACLTAWVGTCPVVSPRQPDRLLGAHTTLCCMMYVACCLLRHHRLRAHVFSYVVCRLLHAVVCYVDLGATTVLRRWRASARCRSWTRSSSHATLSPS